jgi:hypothetical protein
MPDRYSGVRRMVGIDFPTVNQRILFKRVPLKIGHQFFQVLPVRLRNYDRNYGVILGCGG